MTARETVDSMVTYDLIDIGSEDSNLDGDHCTDGIMNEGHADSSHLDCLIDRLPPSLTDEQRITVANLVRANADLGRTHLVTHTINTGDHSQIMEPLRRQPKFICH